MPDFTLTKINEFVDVQSKFEATPVYPGEMSQPAVYVFNPVFGTRIPLRMRSPEITAGAPHVRKRWREIQVHGDGTAQLRVYLDGSLMTLANGQHNHTVDCAEGPMHPRRVLLPPGSWGYSLSYELTGRMDLRAVELGYDTMTSED